MPHLHINWFRVIPKGHDTGKWRMITDLFYPSGYSINNGIDYDLCSLSYMSVERVAAMSASYPCGALFTKVDIESAYHPPGHGMGGKVYVNPMLPFGLRSAKKIFSAIADALEWCVRQRGVRHVFHYLDDNVVIGPPASPECAEALAVLNRTCSQLGVPIVDHKTAGPATWPSVPWNRGGYVSLSATSAAG